MARFVFISHYTGVEIWLLYSQFSIMPTITTNTLAELSTCLDSHILHHLRLV